MNEVRFVMTTALSYPAMRLGCTSGSSQFTSRGAKPVDRNLFSVVQWQTVGPAISGDGNRQIGVGRRSPVPETIKGTQV